MNTRFKPIDRDSPVELTEAFDLLRQLRAELSREQFTELVVEKSQNQGEYRLLGAYLPESGELVALAGVRTLIDFIHGPHWYVDDLVTRDDHRNRGLGSEFLRWIEGVATREGIRCLRLSTGAGHEAGKRFYERNGWALRAVTYKKYWNQTLGRWEG